MDFLVARLTMLFGALALMLAAIGLYGVTAYTVALRTSEIGIRMALGAKRGSVVTMVMRGAVIQAGIGLAIVQRGIQRMGGRVGLESTLGEGSRFWFELKKAA